MSAASMAIIATNVRGALMGTAEPPSVPVLPVGDPLAAGLELEGKEEVSLPPTLKTLTDPTSKYASEYREGFPRT